MLNVACSSLPITYIVTFCAGSDPTRERLSRHSCTSARWAWLIPRIISLWLCQYLAMLAYGVSRDAGKQCAAACDGSQYFISIYGEYLSA
jgi:hypothetical protein